MLYRKGFSLILAASVLLFSVSFASAQFADAKAASEFVEKNYDTILGQYLIPGRPMSDATLAQYKEDLITSRDLKRFRQTLEADAKLKLSLCKAMLEYLEGDSDSAVKTAYRVYTAASEKPEFKNSVIFMAYMAKEYSYIKKMMNQDDPGKAALEPVAPSNAKLTAQVARKKAELAKAAADSIVADVPSAMTFDPNDPTLADPNSPASIAARRARERQQPRSNNTTTSRTPAADPFNVRGNDRLAANNADQKGALELDLAMMPIDMLGTELSDLNLETVNGGYLTYSPNKGKALCILLWVCDDQKVKQQVSEMDRMFTETGGGFGPIQYLTLNCNQIDDPVATKVIFDQVVSYPSLAVHCLMTPANKEQLKKIEPASGVIAIAGPDGIIRYVGPADNPIAKAIIKQEAAAGSSEMAAFVAPSALNPAVEAAVANKAAKDANPEMEVTAYQEDAPQKVKLEEDPTIHQARQKLDLAKTKMRMQFGISFKSALDLCDEILEGWPGTEEAEEAKGIISEICSKNAGRVYRKQRIQEGKYVGEQNEN